MIYLVCFERPFKHARHYLGWCHDGRLDQRIAHHRAGTGARLLAVVAAAGIDFQVVRTWSTGSRTDERRMKKAGAVGRLCPFHCRRRHAKERACPQQSRTS